MTEPPWLPVAPKTVMSFDILKIECRTAIGDGCGGMMLLEYVQWGLVLELMVEWLQMML